MAGGRGAVEDVEDGRAGFKRGGILNRREKITEINFDSLAMSFSSWW